MTSFLLSLTGGLLAALAAPWLTRRFPKRSGWLLALAPLGILVSLMNLLPALRNGESPSVSLAWAESLGLSATFQLDGLGALLAALVAGIGALVLIYGGAYLSGHPNLTRFYVVVLLFMTAMLGLAVSANALLLFIFWELTSITSFLLIGFEHERPAARAAAWQALLVTGGGGLALLAGFILLGNLTGSYEIPQWIAQKEVIAASPQSTAAFLLILAGAMTKSAQFPFHFWLPNAMEAPTPVSAYLHSATMVKAGVFLLARLLPALGGLPAWQGLIPWIGLATLLTGALLSLGQADLKKLLAYTTVASLGALVMLLGINTPLSVKAAMVFLPAHALYKGALFLVAGGVDHAVHTRDIRDLGGLGRAMPLTAAAAGLAALSMAGIPPFFGFIAKEVVYESALGAPALAAWVTALTILANIILAAAAGWVALAPFWEKARKDLHPHEGGAGLWLPPLILAALGLVSGLLPELAAKNWIAPAVSSVLGKPYEVKLSLWHGLNLPLLFSLITLLAAVLLYTLRVAARSADADAWQHLARFGPAAMYARGLKGLLSFAALQTRLLQSGYLRVYVLFITLFTVGMALPPALLSMRALPPAVWTGVRFYDVILVLIIVTAAFFVVRATSRLATIALLGAIGFSIAILFLLYSAPDLAMTQFAVETLTVILFVLVIYRLPKFSRLSSRPARLRDILIAGLGGLMMTLLMLVVSYHGQDSRLASFFMENSLPKAYGRNVVNVILVDFRGFDTLGEITVLAIAAVGVFALVRGAAKRKGERHE